MSGNVGGYLRRLEAWSRHVRVLLMGAVSPAAINHFSAEQTVALQLRPTPRKVLQHDFYYGDVVL